MADQIKPDILLPKCACFETSDAMTCGRIGHVALACSHVVEGFNHFGEEFELCKKALPYYLETLIVVLATSICKSRSPAVQFGSKEMQWEVEHLLAGIEGRLLERVKYLYESAQALGLTEDKLRAMKNMGMNSKTEGNA